jgi:hypothetical protein
LSLIPKEAVSSRYSDKQVFNTVLHSRQLLQVVSRNIHMKNPDRNTVATLDKLLNIGPVMSADLAVAGIEYPTQLIDRNPFELYENYAG